MNSERFWILVLTATAFLAGAAGGFLFAIEAFPQGSSGPFASYRDRLAERYDLPPESRRRLAQILEVYDEEIERLKARQLESFDGELVKAGEDCLSRIEGHILAPILTPDELAAFRRECGLGVPRSSSRPTPSVH
ncbi:MAG TPA: hypothetical protein ENJ09_13875 [Planctomycetes bacterium]|nr:hypothetical protein [Planctomycetota bacterium]